MVCSKEEYRAYLQGLTYKELLGRDRLEALAEKEIDERLDAIRADLESLHIEDLLDHERLEALAEEEIEKRVAAFEESLPLLSGGTGYGRSICSG